MLDPTAPAFSANAAMAHIGALAPGLACALVADAIALSTLVRPLGPRGLKILGWLHKTILCSVVLMWLTGGAMVLAKVMPGGAGISPKLVVKLGVVVLISLNALAIGRIALPQLRSMQGATFDAFPTRTRLQLGLIGGVSSACWMSALALGAIDVFKPMDFANLALCIGPILALGTLAGLAVAMAAPRIGALAPHRSAVPSG